MGKQRNFGLDLTRAVAVVFVLAVHFFMNTGFYYVPMQGRGMLVGAVIRMAFMTCVPLFLMLTGYLCVNRRWHKEYYRRLLPILVTYVLACVLCLIFRMVWMKEVMSAAGWIRRILDFTAAPYGWYIEMYFGLFFLIPFVNAAWNNLKESEKKTLVIVMIGLTALPTLVNLYKQILPDWWTGVYPLTYYVLGAWLREHPLKVKRRWLFCGWIGIAVAAGILCYVVADGGNFKWILISNWESIFVLSESVCLFSCLSRCEGEKLPRPLQGGIHWVAKLSLVIYLVSYISDKLIYPILCAQVASLTHRMLFLPLVVLGSMVVSVIPALVIHWITTRSTRLLSKKETV